MAPSITLSAVFNFSKTSLPKLDLTGPCSETVSTGNIQSQIWNQWSREKIGQYKVSIDPEGGSLTKNTR